MPQDSDRGDNWLSPQAALTRFSSSMLPAPKAETASRRQVRYGFMIAQVGFMMARMTSSEIMIPPAVFRLPNTAPWFLGIANVRGNLIPVFDLAPLLARQSQRDAKQMTLVLDSGDNAVAVMIDGFPKTVEGLSPLEHAPALPGLLETHVKGGYAAAGEIWFDLDHIGLFEALGKEASSTRFDA